MLASFLARRMSLIRADRRSLVGSVVAIAGVALAVCMMMLTVAVSRGFGREVTARLLAFDAPLTVSVPPIVEGESMVAVTPELREVINDVFPGVENVAVWQTPAMVKSSTSFDGLILKNLSGRSHCGFICESLVRGRTPEKTGDILISSETAKTLDVDTADRVDIALFIDGAVKLRRATVAGIYNTHFVDYDGNVAFIDSMTLISALRAEDGALATEVEIFADGSPGEFPVMATRLQNALSKANFTGKLSDYYRVDNFTDTASSYLGWLALLDVNVIVIIGLMAFIAAFTLTSSMIVIVLERVKSIGMLKALGASNGQLQSVFMILGVRLLLWGIAIADAISMVLIVMQRQFHVLPLDPKNYYLDYVPVDMTWQMFMMVNVGAMVLGVLTMFIPVKIIASVRPVQAISFE